MTLPHKQDADALEISELRAEVEKLKAQISKDAIEALSVQGELDAASGSLYNRTRELMEARARIKEAELQLDAAAAIVRAAEHWERTPYTDHDENRKAEIRLTEAVNAYWETLDEVKVVAEKRSHAHEWIGAVPCSRCSYLMQKGGPCTNCGYVVPKEA